MPEVWARAHPGTTLSGWNRISVMPDYPHHKIFYILGLGQGLKTVRSWSYLTYVAKSDQKT